MNIARALTIIGFVIGLRSVALTWGHIGSDAFVLTSEGPLAVTHAWHHYFREVFGDTSAMLVVLLFLFVPESVRSPAAWWAMMISLLGFYLPFWVGVPFMPELAAPNMSAEVQHIIMAVPPMIAVFLCRSYYFPKAH